MLDFLLVMWALPSLCTFLFILIVERSIGTPPANHSASSWLGIAFASVVWPVGLLIGSLIWIVEGVHTNILTKERKWWWE